jgi:flagellar biosynthesis/type III secretory pathway M-ring protein FliF/YscJ
MENASATEPNYDLTSINIKFSDSTPLLSFKNIIAFKEKPTVASPQKNNSWILWVSLIAVLFVLLLFTQKMVKEVNKRKEHDSI